MYPGLIRKSNLISVNKEPATEQKQEQESVIEAEAEAEAEEETNAEAGKESQTTDEQLQDSAQQLKTDESDEPQPNNDTMDEIIHRHLAQIECVTTKFHNSDINICSAFAETVLFIGVLILKRAINISKPQRIADGIKLLLILGFLILYPIYAAVVILVLVFTYYYLRFHAGS